MKRTLAKMQLLPIKTLIAIIVLIQLIQLGGSFIKVRGYEVIADKTGDSLLDPSKFVFIRSKAVTFSECSVSS